MKERLQKYMARSGIASRRHCEEIITAGRVKVNGVLVKELGTKINPEADTVKVDDKTVQAEKNVYVILNKPSGFVTTSKDPQGRPIVTNLLKGIPQRVYPVGRLDYDTEGLLLLTNDGRLTHALTHPKHEVRKTYHALVKGVPARGKIERMKKGLILSDGPTAPAQVRLIDKQKISSLWEIVIHEGRNRQVRRMFEQIGHPVMELKRVKMGNLTLQGLASGKFRYLTRPEISQLKKIAFSSGRQRVKRPIKK